MKTLEQILKQKPVYLHNWKEKIDMIGDFEDLYMTGEEYRAEKAPYQNVEAWLDTKSKMTDAIKKYEEYLLNSPELLKDLHELQGKVLGCWCHPKKCHGDILAKYANSLNSALF